MQKNCRGKTTLSFSELDRLRFDNYAKLMRQMLPLGVAQELVRHAESCFFSTEQRMLRQAQREPKTAQHGNRGLYAHAA